MIDKCFIEMMIFLFGKQVELMSNTGCCDCEKLKVILKKYGVEFGKEIGHEFGKALSNKKIEKLKLKASNDMKKINALIYLFVASCIFFLL